VSLNSLFTYLLVTLASAAAILKFKFKKKHSEYLEEERGVLDLKGVVSQAKYFFK
jgi:hypothetical protein